MTLTAILSPKESILHCTPAFSIFFGEDTGTISVSGFLNKLEIENKEILNFLQAPSVDKIRQNGEFNCRYHGKNINCTIAPVYYFGDTPHYTLSVAVSNCSKRANYDRALEEAKIGWFDWDMQEEQNSCVSVSFKRILNLPSLRSVDTIEPLLNTYLRRFKDIDRKRLLKNLDELKEGSLSEDRFRMFLETSEKNVSKHFDLKVEGIYEQGTLIRIQGSLQDISYRFKDKMNSMLAMKVAKIGWYEVDLINLNNSIFSSLSLDIVGVVAGKNEAPSSVYKRLQEAIHPLDEAYVNSIAPKFLNREFTDDSCLVDFRMLVDDQVRHFRTENKGIYDEKGRLSRVIGTIQDVSDLVLKEEMNSEALEEAKVEWVVHQDPKDFTKTVYSNRFFENIMGIPDPGEFPARDQLLEAIVEKDIDEAAHKGFRERSHPDDQASWVIKVITPDGERSIRVKMKGYYSDTGTLMKLSGTIQNVTEILQREALYAEALAEAQVEWVVHEDPDDFTKSQYSATFFENILGFSDPGSFPSRAEILDLMDDEDKEQDEAMHQGFRLRTHENDEASWIIKGHTPGGVKNIRVKMKGHYTPLGVLDKLTAIMQDITDIVQQEQLHADALKINNVGWMQLSDPNDWTTARYSPGYFERLVGIPEPELYPSREEVLEGVINKEEDEAIHQGFRDRTHVNDMAEWLIKVNGAKGIRTLKLNIKGSYTATGVLESLSGTVQDVTEIIHQQEMHAEALETSKVGWLVVHDVNDWTTATYSQGFFKSIFGVADPGRYLSREEVLASMVDKEQDESIVEAFRKREHPNDKASWVARMISPVGEKTLKFEIKGSYSDRGALIQLSGTIQDITDVVFQEQMHQNALQMAKVGWVRVDVAEWENSTYSSGLFESLFGIPDPGYFPQLDEFLDIVVNENKEKEVMERLSRREFPDDKHSFISKVETPSGVRTHRVMLVGKYNQKNELTDILSAVQDITENVQLEERLQLALRVSHSGWFEAYPDDPMKNEYSEQFLELMELPVDHQPDEKGMSERFTNKPFDFDNFKEFATKMGDFEKHSSIDIPIKLENGNLKHILGNFVPEFSKSGKLIKVFGVGTDITKVREAEQELAESEKRFRALADKLSDTNHNLQTLIESSGNLVMVLDDQLVVKDVYAVNLQLLSADRSVYKGKPLEDFAHGEAESRIMEAAKNCIEQKNNYSLRTVCGKTGTWFKITAYPYTTNNGKLRICTIVENIDQQVSVEEDLRKTIKLERELGDMRSNFVSMASHQFRTPLTVIRSNMELLREGAENRELVHKVSCRLEKEVDRLVLLMEDILVLGKVQSENLKVSMHTFDLPKLLQDVIDDVNLEQVDDRVASLSVKGQIPKVKMDETMIRHAVNNLVSNAFKYSSGSRSPEVRVRINKAKRITVSIIDYGIGIAEDDIGNIFNVFYRAQNAASFPGSGLGLTITREFLTINQCELKVSSKLNEGTTFEIILPE